MPECEKERKGGKRKRRMAEGRGKEAVRGKKRMGREGSVCRAQGLGLCPVGSRATEGH